MNINAPLSRLGSPLRLFFSLLLIIFGTEMIIMFIILPHLFGGVEGMAASIADSSLLTLLVAPFLWFRIVLPQRKQAEEEIRRLNAALEQKVAELTRTQEDLVLKEKLATLGQLSGSVGHELRNPLGVMSNAVYFLKMVLTGADESTKEYLDIIKHEIENSQRIITDLLDFARTKPPQTKTVTATELVERSIGRCTIPGCVSLRSEIPEALPPLRVDPLQMGQVLQNLITNAIQAMPDGGALSIGARRPPHSSQDFVEISVEDSGGGISEENMKKIFEPLFTTKAKGIGLGLVVCRNLVEANGGRIEVESRLSEGSTFKVILPVGGE